MKEPAAPSSTTGMLSRTITTLVVVVILAAALVITWEIILTLFLAVLFAVFLTFASNGLSRVLPIPYQGSLTLLVSTLILLSAGTMTLFFVQIENQVQEASLQIERGTEKIQEWAEEYTTVKSVIQSTPYLSQSLLPASDSEKKKPDSSQAQDSQASEQSADSPDKKSDKSQQADLNSLAQPAKQAASFVGQMFRTTFGLVVNSVLILFVGLFLATAPATYRDGVVILFAPERRERIRQVMNQLGDTLWHWLIGRFGSMLVTGLGAWLVLLLIGVPMAGTLGFLTGLLTFIPNIGAAISFILAILVALPQGTTTAALVIPAYIGLQLLESYVITPLIQKQQVSLPPALLISFQAIMGVLFGFLGAIIASPFLAAVKVIVQELYVKDYLEGNADHNGS
ncbi:MAG: AI-2E family transporter [Gimesia chilikensis]|uniref:AI-2E family transporter n=1 Tax=Gimesia chilikensis TaxID=2605989 RepID=UPI00379313EC